MPVETFETTFGALFIALFIDSIFYGAGILLVMQYFKSFRDHWTTQLFVGTLALLATAQVGSVFAWAYEDLIIRFGNRPLLILLPPTANSQLVALSLISFLTQMFFARRIWLLSKKNRRIFLCAPVVILALLQIGCGLALATLGAMNGTFKIFIKTESIGTIQNGSTAACDILITFILCHVLNQNRTGMKPTDTMLDNLIVYTINRGAMTSIAALLNIILFVARPKAMIFMCALLPSGQLYVISVVATFLTRRRLREQLSYSQERSGEVSLPLSNKNLPPPGIRVSTAVVTWDPVRNGPYNQGNIGDNKSGLVS